MAAKPLRDYDRFVRRYAEHVENTIKPSHERIGLLLERLKRNELWEVRAHESIYERRAQEKLALLSDPDADIPLTEPRIDPNRHPVPTPIHQTKVRLKEVDSAYRKLTGHAPGRKAHTGGAPSKKSIEALVDVLGARIIVYFPHQLTWIDALIRELSELELHEELKPKSFHDDMTLRRLGLDPTTFDARNRKQSGYSSLHYTARFTESELPEQKRPWFEIQVRTLAEELWGEIEHHIGYKPERKTAFSVQRQFRVIKDHLQAIDTHLDFIYDEMQNLQNKIMEPMPGDLLNAENLPAVLSKFALRVSQRDLGKVTAVLKMFDIETVGELEDRADYHCLEEIRDEWRQLLGPGHDKSAYLVLHVLGSLPKEPTSEDIKRSVQAFYELHLALERELGAHE